MRVVLQEEVYCRKTVLQYSLMGPELYCKGLVRKAGSQYKILYCDSGLGTVLALVAGRSGRARGAGG